MKLRIFVLCFVLGVAIKSSILAGEFPKAYSLENGRIVLENEFLRFEVDPKGGGRISSFVDRRDGGERVVPGRVEGLCFDQFYEQNDRTLSGNYFYAVQPYEGEILSAGGDRAAVRVGRPSIPYERGVYNENYDNLYVEREFSLDASSPVLQIKVRIYNRSKEGKRPGYWIRSGYSIGGDREHECYIRPSRRGIMGGGPDDVTTDQMVWDPSYGWTATADTSIRACVVWLMDASRLMMFYNSVAALSARDIDEYPNKYGVDPLWIWDGAGSTTVGPEWYYHKAYIPAGEFWETSIQMISMANTDLIDHACKYFIADIVPPEMGPKGRVHLRLTQAAVSVRNLKISGEMIDLDGRQKSVSLGIGQTDMLTPSPRLVELSDMIEKPGHAAFRFQIEGTTADGRQFSEFFEYIFNSDGKSLDYEIAAPKLKFNYKPSGYVLRPEDNTTKVLYLQGLAFERWGLMEALQEMKAEVRESEFMKKMMMTSIRYFPVTLEEAMQFDLIIMAAIDAFAIGFEGCQILRDYVQNGGSLFVLGGIYGWGGGRYQEYGLDEFLPLSIENTFDLEKGGRFNLIPNEAELNEILGKNSPDWGSNQWGIVYWFHKLKAKPQAKVLVRLGDFPLLAISRSGLGKIACMAGTTLGEGDPGKLPYWAQPAWNDIKKKLLIWLFQ